MPCLFSYNDSKLELRAKKTIFLDYAIGKMDTDCGVLILSHLNLLRDVTFDENYMLQQRRKSFADSTGTGEKTNKQVKLESKVTRRSAGEHAR